MDPTAIWNSLIVDPLTEGLQYLYGLFGSYGIAIIVFTVITRLALLPLSIQQVRSSKAMQELQPQIQALQKKYGKEREKLSQETMKLYKEHGVNPLSGCLPTVVQMPIWIGLYSALLSLSTRPEFAAPFLWISNMAATPNTTEPLAHLTDYILPVITVVSQWIVQKMMAPATVQDPQQQSMNSMMAMMPILFGFFAIQVPAGLVLYWVASNLFSMVQQYFTTGWGSLATLFARPGAGADRKPSPPSQGIAGLLAGLVRPKTLDSETASAERVPTSGPGPKTVQRLEQMPTASSPPKTVQMLDQPHQPAAAPSAKRKPKRSK